MVVTSGAAGRFVAVLILNLVLSGLSGCSDSDWAPRTEFWISPQGNDAAAGSAGEPFAPWNVPPSILSAAGVQNFPQIILDAAGISSRDLQHRRP